MRIYFRIILFIRWQMVDGWSSTNGFLFCIWKLNWEYPRTLAVYIYWLVNYLGCREKWRLTVKRWEQLLRVINLRFVRWFNMGILNSLMILNGHIHYHANELCFLFGNCEMTLLIKLLLEIGRVPMLRRGTLLEV